MRKDITKVITESKRLNALPDNKFNAIRNSKKFQEFLGDYGGKMGLKKAHSRFNYHQKSFGENLTPLIRFLESSVGKPWSEIYSEIKKAVPNNGTLQNHVYQHLYDFVVFPREVFSEKGVTYGKGARSGFGSNPFGQGCRRYQIYWFYVDPLSDVLKKANSISYNARNRKYRAESKQKLHAVFRKGEGLEPDLFKENGCWFSAKKEKARYNTHIQVPWNQLRSEELDRIFWREWPTASPARKLQLGGILVTRQVQDSRVDFRIKERLAVAVKTGTGSEFTPVEVNQALKEMKEKDILYVKVRQLSRVEMNQRNLP